MNNKNNYFILFIFLLCSSYYSQEILEYKISINDIESIMIGTHKNYSLTFKLKKDGRLFLAKLTENNIGKYLKITNKNNFVFLSPIIRAKIDSGVISIDNIANMDEVCRYLQYLKE